MGKQIKLLGGQTATGDGIAYLMESPKRNYHFIVTGTGSVSGTATVYGSDIPSGPWETLITFSASGTTTATDQGETNRQWRYIKANLGTITGTGASATLWCEGNP